MIWVFLVIIDHLDNAMRFAVDPGEVVVSLTFDAKCVRFAVSDNGPGIPDAEKELVFDRFYQSDMARSGREHFGLGLSIAREITLRHRGVIGVCDSVLGGASFYIELPIGSGKPYRKA